jgi:hypothetical protein
MTAAESATCVYAVIADRRQPRARHTPPGLPGGGRVRLLEVPPGTSRSAGSGLRRWLVVSTVPLEGYSESRIRAGLGDLDWVSRAAVAHERTIEAFAGASAVLPMKLFTLFRNDERAIAFAERDRRRLGTALTRVRNHDEFGVRVIRQPAAKVERAPRPKSGMHYLRGKLAARQIALDQARSAEGVANSLYRDLSSHAKLAERRAATERGLRNGPLLLDAVFLVPRSRAARFSRAIRRFSTELQRTGYRVTTTGPWPPYSFVQD